MSCSVRWPGLGCGFAGCADGTAHGVVLLNSNAMDVSLTDTRVTWHVTGGVIDLYFLMGPSPFDVLDQLTQIIGRPIMPPLWSLGLMNSKRAPLLEFCLLPPAHPAHCGAGQLQSGVHEK